MDRLLQYKDKYYPLTIKPQALVDNGLPRAILWNTNLSQEVDSQAFIVSTLMRAYNAFVIEKLVEYFGVEMAYASLDTYRDRVSPELLDAVEKFTHASISA
ncbi:MAG: hypothetical protein DRG30_09350 [Epsilonproteobacteria bacterium]|nr:MAG: hypothetical protein DRG30_09350 [Campylobacterota bacterium]